MATSNKVQIIQIEPLQQGQRLDNFLLKQLKGVPRARVYRLIRRGEVRVNKRRCKPDLRLEKGDQVRIPPFTGPDEKAPVSVSPQLEAKLRASVMVETEAYLVINKPAGLAVHGGSGIQLGVIEALRQMEPDWQHLELAHRLDRDTSGCLLIGKNPIYLKQLQSEFKARTVQKHYLALVHGHWPDDVQQVTAPLLREELSSGERLVKVNAEGKSACTRFHIIERFAQATLIQAEPETGRTHQIRVHCQTAGHPIVGDDRYLFRDQLGSDERLNRYNGLCLHASRLTIRTPDSAQDVTFEAPLDQRFAALLNGLRG